MTRGDYIVFLQGDAWPANETWLAELLAPLAGQVTEVNEALPDDPSIVNTSPYEQGWMVRVRVEGGVEGLMSAADYAAYRAD